MLAFRKNLNNLCSILPIYDCFKNSKLDIFNFMLLSKRLAHHSLLNSESKAIRFPLTEIGNLDPNLLNGDIVKWYEIADEILQAKTSRKLLPEYLRLEDITELLKCDSKTHRFKYLTFLFKKEKKKLNEIEKRRQRNAERATAHINKLDNGHIQYGPGKNTLCLKIYPNSMHKFYDKRLANSILFGPKIVIDLGYDEFMWNKERRDCAYQVSLVHSINRQSRIPYNLSLCNAKSDSHCVQYLQQIMPNIDKSLITITDQSYLDIFPKEDLVYLSPHASEPLKIYDHKAIYIIGGFVDTVHRKQISLFKSQDEGIKSYSLPLDDYILWGCGSRSLSINQVFSIMQTMRDTGDWKEAFKHVPTRKMKKLKADSDVPECMSDKLYACYN